MLKKVLITGAGGFIGSHLTEELVKAGLQVTALVHYNSSSFCGFLEFVDKKIFREVSLVFGDVTDSDQMKKIVKNQEIVLHLAALIAISYSYDAVKSYLQTNVLGTQNLLEAAVTNNVSLFIHTSTSEVYGSAQYLPIDERHPKVGQSPYSASKIGADALVESYHRSFKLPTVILRPFNNFGPRQSARAVIPTIISQTLTQKQIKLGSLFPKRDYLFVQDTAKAYHQAIINRDKVIGKALNIGFGKNYSIKEIIDKIQKIMKTNKLITLDQSRQRPKKSEVDNLLCDNSLAKKLLAWEPRVDFDKGLFLTIDWIEKNIHLYKSERYNI